MQIKSINQTLSHPERTPDGIRVSGSWFIAEYSDIEVYYNADGRPVFEVVIPPPAPQAPKLSWFQRMQEWFRN